MNTRNDHPAWLFVVFPAVAMIDTALSQLVMERGGQVDPEHPRFRVG